MDYSDASIIRSVQYGTLDSLLKQIRRNRSDFDKSEIELADRLSDEPYTKNIISELNKFDPQRREKLIKKFVRRQVGSTLNKIDSKIDFIENTTVDSLQDAIDHLNLLDATYYDSFFKFANTSHHIYSITGNSSIFHKISQQARSAEEAQILFQEEVKKSDDIDELYVQAAAEVPSPIIGDLNHEPKPRLIKFETPERIYIEYWSEGAQESVYDATRGKEIYYNSLKRSIIHIQVDNNIIEYGSTDKTKKHRESVIRHLSTEFSFSKEMMSDGGSTILKSENDLEEVVIDANDLITVIKRIGTISTFESFDGQNATIDYSSIDRRNVQEEPTRDKALEDRRIRRVNTQILFDLTDRQNPKFISPTFIRESLDFTRDANINDYVNAIEKQTEYENVDHITVSLHEEKNTLRIDKERLTPSTRMYVFDLIGDELGWYNGN